MYSEKLKQEKYTADKGDGYCGIEIGEKNICKMLDEFCKKDDIINVPVTNVLNLFDEFCEEMGYCKINHLTLGKVIKKHFNVQSKMTRKKDNLFCRYVEADEE